MKTLTILAPAAIALGLTATGAQAAVTVMAGDADCFGADPGFCTAGAFPAIPVAFDNAAPGDPVGTDAFGMLGTVSLDFFLDLAGATALSASLEVRVAGVDVFIEPGGGGDPDVGMTFDVNGTQVGTFHEPIVIGSDINQRKITTLVFSVGIASLVDGGTNTLVIAPEDAFGTGAFDSYAVDYATLTVETASAPSSEVPIPAPLALLAGGLGLLGFASRRKSASA